MRRRKVPRARPGYCQLVRVQERRRPHLPDQPLRNEIEFDRKTTQGLFQRGLQGLAIPHGKLDQSLLILF